MNNVAATATKPKSGAAIFVSTSIGKKVIVAASGMILLLFVTGHMIGNLQIFIGQEQLNKYAHFLQSLGEILWVVRIVLGLMVVLHIIFAVKLKLENWSARPNRYEYISTVQATLASRTMIWTGLLVFSFVTYHLMHFTFLATHPEYRNLTALLDGKTVPDVYTMVIIGFKQPLISTFYLIMMFMLAYHLSHGIKSMFQTLGWNSERHEPGLNKLSYGLAAFLFLGYIAIPIACLLDLLKALHTGGGL